MNLVPQQFYVEIIQSEKLNNMKNIKSLLFISCVVGLLSCNVKSYEDKVVFNTIDSVEYHGIGQDNTLQTSPYWMCHLKESGRWVRTYTESSVGDSLRMVIRKIKN